MSKMTDAELQAYLKRIRIDESPVVSAEGLRRIQEAHRRSIPFENLDVLSGRGITLEPKAIFTKLVASARGGYCFEHNALFLRALRTIGFDARPLLGRVWLGVTDTPPRTHTFNLVQLPEGVWIADAGFGGGDSPPMPLVPHDCIGSDGVRHRLVRDASHGWMLTRNDVPQYSFTEDIVWPSDLGQANHWTATAPESRFVQNLIVSLLTPDGLKSFRRSRILAFDGERKALDAAALAARLSADFGIALSRESVAALPAIAKD